MNIQKMYAWVLAGMLVAVSVVGIAEDTARPEKWAKPMTCAGVPNLHKVSDKLYRSAQPTANGMTNLVALGIKTVVNLRDNHSDSDEIGDLPLKAHRIEIFTGNMKDKYVTEFLSILDDTNAVPVLVQLHVLVHDLLLYVLHLVLQDFSSVEHSLLQDVSVAVCYTVD